MQDRGLIDADQVLALRERVKEAMRHAVAELTEPDPSGNARSRRLRPELWPSPDFCDVGIRSDLAELRHARTAGRVALSRASWPKRKFIDVVAETLGGAWKPMPLSWSSVRMSIG